MHNVSHLEHLVAVVQDLSLARTLESVMQIVRSAARQLTGADGATFVLREQDLCYYADEDAIAPLWKGRRFPMETCISGWVMLNREAAVIEDIYADERIPAAAYQPTFVKSLVMVPIRTKAPLGAIGSYWAVRHQPAAREVQRYSRHWLTRRRSPWKTFRSTRRCNRPFSPAPRRWGRPTRG